MNFPTGVMPWHKGVIVTAAPEIFYAEDTDGDGKADVRRTLYSGFTQGNPQLRVNDPTWGLDNWVYIANGLSSRGKVRSEKTGAEVEMSGHDARLRPDEGLIETEAGLTEFGRNRSDWGDYFGCDNSHPMWHFVLPERYGRRNPYVGPPKATNLMGLPPNGPVYQLSPEGKRYHSFEHAGHYTSACSAMVYRDELLFSRGTDLEAFVCEPVHNLVQHLVLTESGPTYTASHREDETKHDFLASEDPWCRPVFVTTGPDGALWVVDMYRYMIEHPDWLPQQGRDEYRPFFRLGEDRGRIYRIFPKGQRPRAVPRLDKLGPAELVAALDSPSGWQRDAVQQLLVWSGDKSAVAPLEQLAASSRNPLARLHALCTLDGLNALKPEAIERALRDEHPAVRRQAVRLAETRGKDAPQLIDAAIKLADDPDAKVRLQLACTLGEWDGDAAGRALAKLAMSAGDDPWLAAAVMTSAPRHYAALASAALAAPDPLAVGFFRELLDMAPARNDRADIAKLLAPVMSREGRPLPDGTARGVRRVAQLPRPAPLVAAATRVGEAGCAVGAAGDRRGTVRSGPQDRDRRRGAGGAADGGGRPARPRAGPCGGGPGPPGRAVHPADADAGAAGGGGRDGPRRGGPGAGDAARRVAVALAGGAHGGGGRDARPGAVGVRPAQGGGGRPHPPVRVRRRPAAAAAAALVRPRQVARAAAPRRDGRPEPREGDRGLPPRAGAGRGRDAGRESLRATTAPPATTSATSARRSARTCSRSPAGSRRPCSPRSWTPTARSSRATWATPPR